MASYLVYSLVGLYLPSAVIVLLFIISAIVMMVLIVYFRNQLRDDTFRLPLVFRVLIDFAIRGLEMKEEMTPPQAPAQALPPQEPAAQEPVPPPAPIPTGKYTVKLHGKKMRLFSVITMVYIVLFVVILAISTLWSALLIETSTTCGQEGFDCFADEEEVTDCDTFQNETNGTSDNLVCYRFVFDYITSFTQAGGVTLFLAVMINTVILILIGTSEIPNNICRYVTFIAICIILAFLALGFLIFNLVLPFNDQLLPPDIFTLWVYFATFCFSIFACMIIGVNLQLP